MAQDSEWWPELHPGEKVTLTIDAQVGHGLDNGTASFLLDHAPGLADSRIYLYIRHDHPQVRVTRAEPADGVPQVGELWADQNGRTHFAADFDEDGPLLIDADGMPKSWRGVHTGKHGPIRRLMTVEQIASWR